ncbi:MAG: ABC transporter permease [Ignisphaera sp.]
MNSFHNSLRLLVSYPLRIASRNSKFRIGLTITVSIVALSIIGLIATPYKEEGWGIVTQEAMNRQGMPPCLPFSCPSIYHPFGTDEMGRDLLSRVLIGTHIALLQISIILLASFSLGLLIGVFTGYGGFILERILNYLTEVFLIIPSFILAAALVIVFGRGITSVIIALTATWWPWYARTAYVVIRELRELEFVRLCRVMGAPRIYIIIRHLIPNTFPIVLVQAITDAGSILIEISSINFLIGTASMQSIDLPDWGMIIGFGLRYLRTYWWIVVYPGVFLLVTTLGLVLLGDGLNEFLSPIIRRRWKPWI